MNSLTSTTTRCTPTLSAAAICSASAAPTSTLFVRSGTERHPTTQRLGGSAVTRRTPGRMAAAVRTLAGWLPMSVSSTPSAQAISTLSQRDRLGERG